MADRLGDLPLALDLAGRYLADRPTLTPNGFLAELDVAGGALAHTALHDWTEAQHTPTQHAASLAATFLLHWHTLDETARALFCACGYCAPQVGIPREVLEGALGGGEAGSEGEGGKGSKGARGRGAAVDRALRKVSR